MCDPEAEVSSIHITDNPSMQRGTISFGVGLCHRTAIRRGSDSNSTWGMGVTSTPALSEGFYDTRCFHSSVQTAGLVSVRVCTEDDYYGKARCLGLLMQYRDHHAVLGQWRWDKSVSASIPMDDSVMRLGFRADVVIPPGPEYDPITYIRVKTTLEEDDCSWIYAPSRGLIEWWVDESHGDVVDLGSDSDTQSFVRIQPTPILLSRANAFQN